MLDLKLINTSIKTHKLSSGKERVSHEVTGSNSYAHSHRLKEKGSAQPTKLLKNAKIFVNNFDHVIVFSSPFHYFLSFYGRQFTC